MSVRRLWARVAAATRRRQLAVLALAAAALCVGAGGVRPAVSVTAHADFPTTAPADLAHLLADFSTQPHARSWFVEEERGNYSTWRYRVTFECGARCSGAAAVAHEAGATMRAALQHGRAADHRVLLHLVTCTRLPLLLWPTFCEEMEVDSAVSGRAASGGGGGSALAEAARARCSLWRALSGACARDLRDHRARHHRLLRARLHQH